MAALTKITRAAEHLGSLDNHIRAYVDSDAWQTIEEVQPDGKTAVYRLRIGTVPLMVSAIAGDIYGCLHECLDHLAWAFGPGEKRSQANKETAFPLLVKDPKHHRSSATALTRSTWGMNAAAQQFVHAFQPYHALHNQRKAGADITNVRRHLGALVELSNRDKHRKLTPLALGVSKGHMHLPAGDPTAIPLDIPEALKDGDIIPAFGSAPIDKSYGAPNFHLTRDVRLNEIAYPRKFAFKVGIDIPIHQHLHSMINAVTAVYNAFAPRQDELLHENRHWENPGWP